MPILKTLRKNPFLNTVIRNFLKKTGNFNNKISSRWRVSGNVQLNFNNIPFKYSALCDDHIVDLMFYGRKYQEEGELRLFVELAKHSKFVLDIGANTGLYSILTSLSNPDTEIIAFEPHPTNITRLKQNIALNNLSNIKIIEKALGNNSGEVNFSIPADNSVADTSSANGEFSRATYEGSIQWKEIKVPQITLDSLIEDNVLQQVDLVKLDVEGYEIEVLQGAASFFKKFSPVILCEIFLDEKRKSFFDKFLSDNNYKAYLVLQDGLLRLENGLIKNFDGLNYIFSKKTTANLFTSFKNIDSLVSSL